MCFQSANFVIDESLIISGWLFDEMVASEYLAAAKNKVFEFRKKMKLSYLAI